MRITETHTKVLIVGAGPSGLMMAAQLLRNGLQPVIVDSKSGPTDQSKALAVQARSLEIYRQMGVADKVIGGGKPGKGIIFNEAGKEAAALPLANIGEGLTAFPYILMYQQYKNERLLLDYLTLNACTVYWETTVISLKQTGASVEVRLQNGDDTVTLVANWVVGADSAHSVVRKQSQIPFNGETYSHNFYLADVELDNPELDDSKIHLYLGKGGFGAFFPMPEPNRYRALGNLPPQLENEKDLNINDILPALDKVTGIDIKVTETYWTTIYRLHHRMADHFRAESCFLIGDAAHIHSPVGGQGMNTGLQDAYNLAWKLAGVANGRFNQRLLETYAAERMPVARALLSTTDKVFTMVMSGSWLAGIFKKFMLPGLLKFVWGRPAIRTAFFKRVSQINISYRDSSISLNISQGTRIKAGDRLPYLKVYDEKKLEETDLHQWCTKPGFTLIIFGKLAEQDLFAIAKWVTQKYPGTLNLFYLPMSTKNRPVFDAFEVNDKVGKSIIVRPDLHIGFMNDRIDMGLMDNYLRNVVGVLAVSSN